MIKDSEKTKNIKLYTILVVISLIIGMILGIIISKNPIFSKDDSNKNEEINILNKEIDYCISQLNDCQEENKQDNNVINQ